MIVAGFLTVRSVPQDPTCKHNVVAALSIYVYMVCQSSGIQWPLPLPARICFPSHFVPSASTRAPSASVCALFRASEKVFLAVVADGDLLRERQVVWRGPSWRGKLRGTSHKGGVCLIDGLYLSTFASTSTQRAR